MELHEGEHACCEPFDFKAKYIEQWFDKDSVGKPAILDVLECENNDYVTNRTKTFLATPIESSSPGSPIQAAWDNICNTIDEKFSSIHIRKGTIEMFLRREVDCKNPELKIISPGLTAISLPMPRSLGSDSDPKDTSLTIFSGLASVLLPLPRRLESVVETKNDMLPIAHWLSTIQLPLPSALNHVARIRGNITHDVTLAEVCDAECSSSSKEKDQYVYDNDEQLKMGKSNGGGREQIEYKIQDRKGKIECSSTQGGGVEDEKMQKACLPFHDDPTTSGTIMPVATESTMDR